MRLRKSSVLIIAVAALLGTNALLSQTKAPVAAPAPASNDAALRALIAKAYPGVQIEGIRPSPLPGFREVVAGGRVVYVSADGKYMMQGNLVRLQDKENLTQASEAVLRKASLNAAGADRRIIFAPPNPKYRVTVFTDIDCGFCRKLHAQVPEYNKRGIAIEYLFFPRAGIGSKAFDDAVSVWCAPDRLKAMTDAKAGRPVKKTTCKNPITADYQLGQRVGVDGTPAIYTQDGTQIGGYLPPDDMLKTLEKQVKRPVASVK
jgi:thiol:disulfide interchange protein DsbC